MEILIQDSFTDADGTLITAHTPNIGGAWVSFSDPPLPKIYSNRCKSQSASVKNINNALNPIGGNAYAQANLYGAGAYLGLFLRYIDTGGYDYLVIQGTYSLLTLNGSLIPFIYTPGAKYKIKRVGNVIYAYENDIEVYSLITPSDNSGRIQFRIQFAVLATAIDDYEAGGEVVGGKVDHLPLMGVH